MKSFLKTSFFIMMMIMGGKGLISTGKEYAAENKEALGAVKEVMAPDKIAATKEFLKSAVSPIEINGQTVDLSENSHEAVGQLYSLAQKEANNMVATGNTEVYEEQLEKNQPFLKLLGSVSQ